MLEGNGAGEESEAPTNLSVSGFHGRRIWCYRSKHTSCPPWSLQLSVAVNLTWPPGKWPSTLVSVILGSTAERAPSTSHNVVPVALMPPFMRDPQTHPAVHDRGTGRFPPKCLSPGHFSLLASYTDSTENIYPAIWSLWSFIRLNFSKLDWPLIVKFLEAIIFKHY